MDRILFGDNQFFGVNHVSDEKARQMAIKYRHDDAILNTLKIAKYYGIDTFMCTTHDRMITILNSMVHDNKLKSMDIYPCLPYAHKYANAVTELGILGTVKQYIPGNYFSSILKGGVAFLSKDYISMMELMIDAELKMFRQSSTPVIFLQNVVTDLLLGLRAYPMLYAFNAYVKKKYNAEAGFITMNLPLLHKVLLDGGIENPIICTSFNKEGFRMSGGTKAYEAVLAQNNARIIAMQIFGGGFIAPKEAIEYVNGLPGISSILFGASSAANIKQTVGLIHQ